LLRKKSHKLSSLEQQTFSMDQEEDLLAPLNSQGQELEE
jgi:hypothetical protein